VSLAALFAPLAAAAPAPPDLVIAGFGGYGSCGYGPLDHPVAAKARELAHQLQEKRRLSATLLLSCFGATPGDPDVTEVEEPGGAAVTTPRTVEDLAARLTVLARGSRQQRVIVAGHSHGGWLAMQVALALPRDVHVAFLVTIDPISRVKCDPLRFAATVAAKTIGDPHHDYCESFPPDVSVAQQSALAGRTLGWLHFYQTQTQDLHSSGAALAHRSRRVEFSTGQTGGSMEHAYIAGAPEVWRDVTAAALNDAAVPVAADPNLQAPTGSDAPLFLLPDAIRSWRLLSRYRKATAVFYPRRGDKSHAVVYQPNVAPVAGVDLEVSANLGVEYDRSLPMLQRRSKLGSTSASAFDLHYVRERFSVDLYLHDYHSLFRETYNRHDVRPFRDALFGGVDDATVFPSMRLTGAGLDGVFTLWPDRFSNLAAMSQSVIPLRGGWSPVAVASLRYSTLSNDAPILPPGFFNMPGWEDFAGLRAWSATLLPGAAGVVVKGPWYLAAIGAYGYGYQHFEADRAPLGSPDQAVADTALQGSVGYSNLAHFMGLTAFYGSLASDAGNLGVFQTLSSVEAFYGRRF
jgi:hypothetical protein